MERKNNKASVITSLVLHLHPRTLPAAALEFNRTMGLGGMAALLVVFQVLTGIMLRFVYEPFPGMAYESILHLQRDVLFGQFVRNIHHWSGTVLVLVAFLHLLRVFFTGAFHAPRQFNWILGVCLLILVVFSNFTGYLLPWDQLAYWAITVSTSMLEYVPGIGSWLEQLVRGGADVGPATLLNFYTFHTAILPAVLVLIMTFHFWRVRKAGGIILPAERANPTRLDPNTETGSLESAGNPAGAGNPGTTGKASIKNNVPVIPNLVVRELAMGLVLLGAIMLYSAFFNAPLQDVANPGFSPNPAKAPWYFMGFQELLLHLHPLFAAIIVPVLIVGFLMRLPYLTYDSPATGEWFISEKGRRMAGSAAWIAVIVVPLLVLADEYLPDLSAMVPSVPSLVSNGLIPVCILGTTLWGYYRWMKKKYSATNNETGQALFILLLVAFVVLTVIGIWFRGEGMHLGLGG